MLADSDHHTPALMKIEDTSASRESRIALVNQGDHRQWTPLHVAAAGGFVGVTKLLLAAGCSCSLRNNEGLTALELAEQLMRREVSAILSRHEAMARDLALVFPESRASDSD